jgi:hypothetical protein
MERKKKEKKWVKMRITSLFSGSEWSSFLLLLFGFLSVFLSMPAKHWDCCNVKVKNEKRWKKAQEIHCNVSHSSGLPLFRSAFHGKFFRILRYLLF